MTFPYYRELIIVNTKEHKVVATRYDTRTASAARITKGLYKTLTDGKHIAYYAHQPSKIRVPAEIKGRFYVKPTGWTPKV